jgi:hypothetical protein
MRRGWSAWLILTLCGCAGYRLGPTDARPAGARSVQVGPFRNTTAEPRVGDAVTASLRKQLQQDGTFRLPEGRDGDIVVDGTVVRYDRTGISYAPQDVATPQEYRITVTARVTARERATGRLLLDREVKGRTSLWVGPDLTSAERQALPVVAEDLARRITDLLVDGEW